LAIENRTATKLDYYVKPSVKQDVQLTKEGVLIVRTTVVVDNQAPAGQTTPSYQLGPDQFTKKPGDYLAWVLLWGPPQSRQVQGGVKESGLNLSQYVIGVNAGERREVSFDTAVPNAIRGGRVELRLVPQPRLEAAPLTVPGFARSFFEQIGQFSTNRLWRQKVGGTRRVYVARVRLTFLSAGAGPPDRPLRGGQQPPVLVRFRTTS